jgi:hypothetical protein
MFLAGLPSIVFRLPKLVAYGSLFVRTITL